MGSLPLHVKFNGFLTAVVFFFVAVQAHADLKITTTETRIEANGTRYFFLAEWDSNQGGRSVCDTDEISLTRCHVTIAALKAPGTPQILGSGPGWTVPTTRNYSSMSDLLRELNKVGFRPPYNGSILVPNGVPVDRRVCISYMYSLVSPSIGAAMNPLSSCVSTQPRPPRCEVQGDLNIDHKSLGEDQLQGAMASTQLSLVCQDSSNIIISVSRSSDSGVPLRSNNTLFSKITVNGKDATNGVTIAVSKNRATSLTVTSMLTTSGRVAPGPFYGNTVITVSLP